MQIHKKQIMLGGAGKEQVMDTWSVQLTAELAHLREACEHARERARQVLTEASEWEEVVVQVSRWWAAAEEWQVAAGRQEPQALHRLAALSPVGKRDEQEYIACSLQSKWWDVVATTAHWDVQMAEAISTYLQRQAGANRMAQLMPDGPRRPAARACSFGSKEVGWARATAEPGWACRGYRGVFQVDSYSHKPLSSLALYPPFVSSSEAVQRSSRGKACSSTGRLHRGILPRLQAGYLVLSHWWLAALSGQAERIASPSRLY
jgi:hypothetical protein